MSLLANSSPGTSAHYENNWLILAGFAFCALSAILVIIGRLYFLQLVRGEEFTQRSETNFIQKSRLSADRGFIYDSYGHLLLDNRPTLDVTITAAFVKDQKATLEQLATLLSLDEATIKSLGTKLRKLRGLDRFVPTLVKRDITFDELAKLENARMLAGLDGVDIEEGLARRYRYGNSAGHVLGYMNEIGPKELEQRKKSGQDYRQGDMIGRMGLESQYEELLHGKNGFRLNAVDSHGRRLRGLTGRKLLQGMISQHNPEPGESLIITLDIELQQAAEEAFREKGAIEGAMVVVDINTGYILAMVSLPLLDVENISGSPPPSFWQGLINNPYKPLLNRTIQEHYSPGSTYKPITALAGLKNGAITTKTKYHCPGFFTMGRSRWRCWNDWGHGSEDLHSAMKHSCDVYFYNVGAEIGLDALAAMAADLGFGKRSGLELGIRKAPNGRLLYDEQPGIIPTSAYRARTSGGYQKGDVVNNSIGQGDTNVTPLQLAMAYATIANGGTLLKPQLLLRTEDSHGKWHNLAHPIVRSKLAIAPEDLEAVVKSICAVVGEPGGGVYHRRSKKLNICGKTGTAQVIRIGRERIKKDEMEYQTRDNAWFAAFAPAEDPQIAVAVVNEHGGSGGSAAAPIAIKTIEAWYDLTLKRGTGLSWHKRWIMSGGEE